MNTLVLIDGVSPEATREVASTAYKELLHGPVPKTGSEFRRAIVQAVLIGRVLESSQAGTTWQKAPPASPGVWEMRCAETNHEPSTVRVFAEAGVLWVENPAIGTNTLEHYHFNLIDIQWRPVVQM